MNPRCPFQLGDKVIVAPDATRVWQIIGLWPETFHSGVQWVARLRGPGQDMSMRVAHLRPAP